MLKDILLAGLLVFSTGSQAELLLYLQNKSATYGQIEIHAVDSKFCNGRVARSFNLSEDPSKDLYGCWESTDPADGPPYIVTVHWVISKDRVITREYLLKNFKSATPDMQNRFSDDKRREFLRSLKK